MTDDPALPERYLGHRLRVAQTAAVVGRGPRDPAARRIGCGRYPLMYLATQAAGFPSRRAILDESWGLRAYLSHVVRVTLAGFGFWLLLAFTPALIPDLGPVRWPMAAALAIVLVAWQARYAEAFLALTRATTLQRPELAPRAGEGGRPLARGGPAPAAHRRARRALGERVRAALARRVHGGLHGHAARAVHARGDRRRCSRTSWPTSSTTTGAASSSAASWSGPPSRSPRSPSLSGAPRWAWRARASTGCGPSW